jgi:hypothetical protein
MWRSRGLEPFLHLQIVPRPEYQLAESGSRKSAAFAKPNAGVGATSVRGNLKYFTGSDFLGKGFELVARQR